MGSLIPPLRKTQWVKGMNAYIPMETKKPSWIMVVLGLVPRLGENRRKVMEEKRKITTERWRVRQPCEECR